MNIIGLKFPSPSMECMYNQICIYQTYHLAQAMKFQEAEGKTYPTHVKRRNQLEVKRSEEILVGTLNYFLLKEDHALMMMRA
jgi:hypothetical protein